MIKWYKCWVKCCKSDKNLWNTIELMAVIHTFSAVSHPSRYKTLVLEKMDFSGFEMENGKLLCCVSLLVAFGIFIYTSIYQSILQSIREQNINCICGSKLCAKRVNWTVAMAFYGHFQVNHAVCVCMSCFEACDRNCRQSRLCIWVCV